MSQPADSLDQRDECGWKRGYPPGKYYDGMLDDYEVAYTVGGYIWHRRRPNADSLDQPQERTHD